MTFKPGVSGNPGGRPKKFIRRPDEILHDKGICPVTELLKLLPDLAPGKQADVWIEILPYCAAKLKDTPSEDALEKELRALTDEELRRRVKEALGKAA